jgi:hypothetical protein
MPKLIASTQYMENYGFHMGADGPWKAKFGEDYVLVRVPDGHPITLMKPDELNTLALEAAKAAEIHYANPASRETLIGCRLVADDWMSDDERFQLQYEGKIEAPMKDLTAKTAAIFGIENVA